MSPDSFPQDQDELVAMFIRELEAAGGHGFICDNQEDLIDRVLELCGNRSVLLEEDPSTEPIRFRLLEAGVSAPSDMWDAEVGVAKVDFAVAATGTLVLMAGANRLLGASLLPYMFIALVDRSCLLADFDGLIRTLDMRLADFDTESAKPSAIHLITGPSRTGDVEMQLTMGVHGPPEVYALLYE
ncbi:MAG: lactate utilization protein [Actinobacteria bacterium]|jgi:L-lactate dehydrogenase complex protein LldG|nr:lactate utilization protein [Actinomycetota bacterium]